MPAVRLFAAVQSQWRCAGMKGFETGLDYAGVDRAASWMGMEMTRDLFQRLRIMETAALKHFDDRRRAPLGR